MLDIVIEDEGVVRLSGRFDATQAARAEEILGRLEGHTVADLSGLEYISSAGIGVILKTFRRLHESGQSLRLVNLTARVRMVFTYAGLDRILTIE